VCLAGLTACAPEPEVPQSPVKESNIGFLSDYSLLGEPDASSGVVVSSYIDPKLSENIELYSGVMVDQPEIFMSPDSPYLGVKPDMLKLLADQVRYLMIGELIRDGYNVVEEPAGDIVYLRIALTKLKVATGANTSAYIPVNVTDQNRVEVARKLMGSMQLLGAGVEVEVVDSAEGHVLMAAVLDQKFEGTGGGNLESWAELGKLLEEVAAAISCLVQNANLPADARKNICAGRSPEV